MAYRPPPPMPPPGMGGSNGGPGFQPFPGGPPRMPMQPTLGVGLAAGIDQTKAKHTTVFVGNITDVFPDNLVRDLLGRCGNILKWNRAPGSTGRLPSFGFCTFSNPDETLRCIRLLNGVKFGERLLNIKVDKSTEEFLEKYIKERIESRGDEVDDKGLDAQARADDVRKRQQIGLFTDKLHQDFGEKIHEAAQKLSTEERQKEQSLDLNPLFQRRDYARKDEGLDDHSEVIVDEVAKFRSAIKDDEKKRREKEEMRQAARREIQRREAKEKREEAERAANAAEVEDEPDPMKRAINKARQAKAERIASEQRRRMQQFKRRERDLLDREKQLRRLRKRNADRIADRLEDREKARDRQGEFERKYYDEKDDSRYFRDRDFDRLKREINREAAEDAKDAQREKDAIEAQRKAKEEAEAKAKAKAEAEAKAQAQAEAEAKAKESGESEQMKTEPENGEEQSQAVDHNVAATTVMDSEPDNAQKAAPQDAEPASKPTALGGASASVGIKLGTTKRPSVQTATSVFGAGNDDDEEAELARKRSKIVPLKYSDAELRAAGLNPEEERRRRAKQIVDSIPSDKEALFATKVDWSQLSTGVITERIQPWIARKFKEYLGEDEPALVEFVCEKVVNHEQPSAILNDISSILDEDADMFVIKLWRLIIFETEARKHGISEVQ